MQSVINYICSPRQLFLAIVKKTNFLYSDAVYLRLVYSLMMKKSLHLKNPVTFNEKLQWLKLNNYQYNPLVWQCADKLRVREYVKSIGEGDILTKLIAVYDKASDIDWNALPNSFAIKTNHGCGSNIICPDKSKLDKEQALRKLNI